MLSMTLVEIRDRTKGWTDGYEGFAMCKVWKAAATASRVL